MLPTVLDIYKMKQTVFTVDELAMVFGELSANNLKRRISYWVKTGKLRRVRRGIFVKDNYVPRELAVRIYKPSYVSLETVLAEGGVIFQSYETIFLVASVSREIVVDGHVFRYAKLANKILLDSRGVGSLERAFLDTIYLRKNYHFDNLRPIDWGKVKKLVEVYGSRALRERVEVYFEDWRRENV